ncbi:MAG: nitroreductase [Paracoccaceae bacterium]
MTLDPTALDDLFAKRYSCRGFKPDPVSQETIASVIRTAGRSPSWCNAQPWQLVVTSGEETDRFRAALMNAVETSTPKPDLDHPTKYTGVYQERRRTCGWQLYESVGVEKGDRAGSAAQMLRNFEMFGAPHMVLLSSPVELGAYGAMDCGGFVTAFCIAAQAHGVDTIPQAAVATYGPLIHEHFGIGDDRIVLCAISFGYGDPDHPANGFRTERASLDDLVDWRG